MELLPETNPDFPVVMWLTEVVSGTGEAKDRIDAAIILMGYAMKWGTRPAFGRSSPEMEMLAEVKAVMKTIALDKKVAIGERIRAAAVSL